MNQPVPSYKEQDLERVIAREVLRVQMACLKRADGGLEALEIENACNDYRDVLAAAEYPRYLKAHGSEARQSAIESDWSQLQSWLNRK